ncbi:MAG: hypothetical protein KBE04_11420 [Phycisphaerae bacterium]|nr:hypothetical protein [Phycisphaerae bacterium]
MKLSDVSLYELRRSLKATEAVLGPQAKSALILRRELQRRLAVEREKRRAANG